MRRLILLLILLSAVGSCSRSIESDAVPPVNDVERATEPLVCAGEESEHQTSSDRRISFENVGFSIDSNWIQNVEYFVTPECILASEEIKPDPIGARTLRFHLWYDSSDEEARILVFRIDEYKNAFARFPHYVENRDSELLAMINGTAGLKRFGLTSPPHVRWMDASELFFSKAKRIEFVGGRGILTVTSISQDDFVTISNSHLLFHFQGFTSDGRYFVEMDFPINLEGLPNEGEEFLPSRKTNTPFYSPARVAAYKEYLLKTAARIDKARPRDFRPSADLVERFIREFEIES